MSCTKAIIMMAGYGTRRLPITKALQKEMLPVGDRPMVDYKIEECIKAGINEFILVVGEEFDQVRSYYGQNLLLEAYLESKGKHHELEEIRTIDKKARFRYVVQDQYQPYGTSTPVWLARNLVKPDEKFLVLNGDDFTLREDGGSDIADMIEAAEIAGAQSAMLVQEVDHNKVDRYGILTIEERDGKLWCKGLQEQPTLNEAASNLANLGSYYFDTKIFDAVERNVGQNFEREHRLTEAMNDYYLPEGNSVLVIKTKGEFMDCGNTEGWLYANQRVIGSKSA